MHLGNAKHISKIVASFKHTFNDETVCRKALFRYRWPDGFSCPRCGCRAYYLVKTRSLYECKDCRSQTSLTAGTVMHNTNLPLQYWFLVIHLSAEGIIFSARWLSKTLQINYRSAHRMLHAVRFAMRSQNGLHLLSKILNPSSPLHASDAKPKIDNAIWRAKHIMIKKAHRFIRIIYRAVDDDYKQRYIDEFYFQWSHRIGDRMPIFQSLMSACTTQPEFRIKKPQKPNVVGF